MYTAVYTVGNTYYDTPDLTWSDGLLKKPVYKENLERAATRYRTGTRTSLSNSIKSIKASFTNDEPS